MFLDQRFCFDESVFLNTHIELWVTGLLSRESRKQTGLTHLGYLKALAPMQTDRFRVIKQTRKEGREVNEQFILVWPDQGKLVLYNICQKACFYSQVLADTHVYIAELRTGLETCLT